MTRKASVAFRRPFSRFFSHIGAAFLIGLGLVWPGGDVSAKENWQLSYGPFTTAANVVQHNRLPLDLADIRAFLAGDEPDFTAALGRYAFGGGFKWRDGFHSLGIFADDYQGRMARVLPGAMALYNDPSFAHRMVVSAMMGTGQFRGTGQTRSQPPEFRRAFVEDTLLATVLNWCRLELSEASIRGPERGNWSLQNGSPKNWSELFAFWWGPEGRHSLHEEMTRIVERFTLPVHPTDLIVAPLATGQESLLKQRWPEEEANEIRKALDLAALLLVLDRVADMEAAVRQEDLALTHAAVRGVWIAAGDALARADLEAARALDARLNAEPDPTLATALRDAIAASLDSLGLDASHFGQALG